MSKFGPSVNTAPRAQQPLPVVDKQIFWGSQDGGCKYFPKDVGTINNRKKADYPEPFIDFGLAIIDAVKHVWIVDEYFLIPDTKRDKQDVTCRINTVLEWLHTGIVANDIRILTKRHTELDKELLNKFQQRASEINAHSTRRGQECKIEVKTHLTDKCCNFIHDRFAIIDDELWHFGGTVGGFHASVSAASRGWRASDHGAIEFFEMIWNLK
jgi:hypothetical protein